MYGIFLPMLFIVVIFMSPAYGSAPGASNVSMDARLADTGVWPLVINYDIKDVGVGYVTMVIDDSEGLPIRHIDCGIKANGSYVASWDGRDDNGYIIAAGNYSIIINYTPDSMVEKVEWGGLGRPSDIAVGREGNVFVAEYDSHRIQKFDPSGRLLGEWGGYGNGDGQFVYPSGIAVGDNGIIYVADLGNSRIEMFSDDGGYIGQWGTAGKGIGEFSMPHGIALDGSGNVYVADMGNHRVQKFTATGKCLGSIGGFGRKDGLFLSPADVAVYDNTVIVSDIDRNMIQSFTTDGAFINAWGTTGSGIGQFNGPAGLATDGGYVYVADMNNHRIQEFDSTGQYVGTIGAFGRGQSLAAAPAGVAVDETGNIYVADISNNKVDGLFNDPSRENLAVQKCINLTIFSSDTLAQDQTTDTAVSMATVSVQGSGPITFINLTGDTGNAGWYRSNVMVRLNASPKSGTAVTNTYYRLNNGTPVTYLGPFNITTEGTTTVSYYSTDSLGIKETEQFTNVKIDKKAPKVMGKVLTDPVANGWYTGTVTINFTATDALSGVVNVTADQTISVNGITPVTGSAYDLAGNVGNMEIDVKVDNEPPVTSIYLSGTAGSNGWYTTDVRVNFSARDGESGVKNTEYSLDGGVWKPAIPFIISKEGATTVYYRSTDAVGNVEEVNTQIIKIDGTAPLISGSSRQPDRNGWYVNPVTISFSATDMNSGVASISKPVTLPINNTPLDGPHQSVTGWATDYAGNTASCVVGNLNIDMLPPVTTCTLEGEGGSAGDNPWHRSDVIVKLSAYDVGSGVNDTKYSLNYSDWCDYHPFNISSEGITILRYNSTDNVGHEELIQTTNVCIDKTPPNVTYDIITNKGINGWYTEPVVIHFLAADNRSGVVSITPDLTLSSDGMNQSVTGYATDAAGNIGSVTVTGLNLDVSTPVTSCVLNRTPNADGWFKDGDVGVTLSTMGTALSGARTIHYSFSGIDWKIYNSTISVTNEGNNVLYFYATDDFGHTESLNAENIRIDRTPPVMVGVPDRHPDAVVGNDSWYTRNVTVHFNAYDLYSGIKSVTPDIVLYDVKGQTVSGSAMDMAGYTNSTTTEPFNVDGTPPVTTCVFSGRAGNNGWNNSSGTFTLSADDGNGIGIDYTCFKLDNGSWIRGNQSILIENGTHRIEYYSVDLLNNTEPVHNMTVRVDSVPPSIRAVRSIQPTQYGWYNGSLNFHFIASDDLSGLASISPDVTLSNDGVGQTVVGTATDYAGNVATYNDNNINIDKTAPSTSYTLEGSSGLNGWNTSNVKVTFNISDLGPLNTYHSLDNQHWSTTNPFTITDEGSLTVYYYSRDMANNTEAVKSFTLKVDKTAPVITATVSGTQGLPDAYRSDVAVGFSTNDISSGLANAFYSTDGTTWKPLANITLTAEGDYDIPYNGTDNAGNKASGELKFSIYKSAPAVNSTTPAANADGVLTDGQPIISFKGRLDPTSINNSTVTLTSVDGEKVNATLRYVETGNTSTVTIMPSGQLQPYTMYTVLLTTDLKDPAGNHLASPYTWSFTTGYMDSAGNKLATPTPEPTPEPVLSPTPKPGGIPIIGSLPSIPVVALLVVVSVLAVGGMAYIYLTKIRK